MTETKKSDAKTGDTPADEAITEAVKANRAASREARADADAAPAPPPEPPVLTEDEAARAVYRFVGPDEIAGIPPRDLTALDVARLTPAQRRDALVSPPGGSPRYVPAE